MNGLYIILTNPFIGYENLAKIAVSSGVSAIQLRIKDSSEDKLKIANNLKKITENSDTYFIINDDIDLAIEVNADGVHLGQEDMSLLNAREKWNDVKKIIGISTHNLKQALEARKNGANYIGVGPIYSTESKKNLGSILGIIKAQDIVDKCQCPSFAIGGIGYKNLNEVKNIGTNGFCVLGAVNNTADPRRVIKRLQEKWKTTTF